MGNLQSRFNRELLYANYMHKRSIAGLGERAEKIKADIKSEQARKKPDAERLARLRKIEDCIAATLERCR
jgi:hypothetical protein